jgi:hypothetical protein
MESTTMTDEDLQRVRAARERALARANEFFGSLSAEQVEAAQACAQPNADGSRPTIDRGAIAERYQAEGWLPKADYLAMERIIADFQAGMPTGDADFESMLRILREGTEAIVRVRVLAFLGQLVKREDPGSERIARIEQAISPLREGPEDLDIMYWNFVRQALDALEH